MTVPSSRCSNNSEGFTVIVPTFAAYKKAIMLIESTNRRGISRMSLTVVIFKLSMLQST
jgi:hypothetical protein